MEYLTKGMAAAKKMAASASGVLGLKEKRMDRSLEEHAKKLKHLERMQESLRKSLHLFQKKAVGQSQAQLRLAQHIGLFYKSSKSRQKSIKEFIKIHQDIDQFTAGTFNIQFDDVVTSVVDEWTDLTKKARNYLDKTNREIAKVRREEVELHKLLKRGEAQNTLEERQRALTAASKNVDEMKSELEIMVSKLVDMRFNIFDECFVRLMETQVAYYERAASMIGALNTKISQYRSKRPRVLSKPVEKLISPLPSRILGTDSKRDASPGPRPMERPGRERKRAEVHHQDEDEDEDEDEDDEGLDEPTSGKSAAVKGSARVKFAAFKSKSVPAVSEPVEDDEDEDGDDEPRIELTPQDERALAQAEMYKKSGITAFKDSKFEEAIKAFANAINVLGYGDRRPNTERADEVLDMVCSCLSNKAMCEKQLHNHKNIVSDTTLCIQLRPAKAMVVKNLVRRGFAYMALDKMQDALNDMLSARNMGCTTASVMKAISQTKKEAKMPSKISEYKCREPKKEAKSRRPARPARQPNGVQAARQPSAVDILGLGGSPQPARKPAAQPSQGNQTTPGNLFDWDSPDQPKSRPPAPSNPVNGAPSWMNLDSNNPTNILEGFGGGAQPAPSKAQKKKNDDPFGINYDDIFSSSPRPAETKAPANDQPAPTFHDEPAEDHIEGGPITKLTHILHLMSENEFWSFAQDNLSIQQLHSTPRDRKMAIKHVIRCGINNPSFVESWKESMEEKKYKVALDKWEYRAGIRKDLMALLSGLHNLMELVPWKGRKWKRVGLGDLQDANKRKKFYKKAMLVVHPDHNGNASAAQRAIAERAFNAMTEALKLEPPY